MHGQPSDSPHPGEPIRADQRDRRPAVDRAQSAVLILLLGDSHHGLWSREELQRALSAENLIVADAIAELVADGLAYELDGFILASHAARSFDQLDL